MICAIIIAIAIIHIAIITFANKNIISDHIENQTIAKLLYVIVSIAGIYMITQRTYYLPFLGETVLPASVLAPKVQKSYDDEIRIEVPGRVVKVVYWAADKQNNDDKTIKSWNDAYNKFDNSGVALVSNNVAIMKIQRPQTYTVGQFGVTRQLPAHIHYRLVYMDGTMSEIYTYNI